jgi:hypothetical protein
VSASAISSVHKRPRDDVEDWMYLKESRAVTCHMPHVEEAPAPASCCSGVGERTRKRGLISARHT